MRIRRLFAALLIAGCSTTALADTLTGDGFAARFALLGQVQPRQASDIAANDWSIGAEAQDRDYSTYNAWRAYLGPLGVKHARLQSGWARTDKGRGVYDYAWLDPVVDDMRAQGVQPWLSLAYGNEAHEGGGTPRRDSTLPTGAGRKAWLEYVRTTVARYRGRIQEYEIWNEPDLNARIKPEEYGQFAAETAKVIRAADPDAGIILGAFAHSVWDREDGSGESTSRAFARVALEVFVKQGGRGLAKAVTYHAYHPNPDAVYPSAKAFIAMVAQVDPGLQVRQGENGAPSLNQQHYALRNMWWTEETQAKWLLRRMLGDAAHGIPTSIFSMTEMHYPVAAETNLTWVNHKPVDRPAAATSKHFKGLLETRLYAPGTPEDDRTVVRTKMGYPAMQAVTAIFDARVKPVALNCVVTGPTGSLAVYGFVRDDGARALAIWRNGDMPGQQPGHEPARLSCPGFALPADALYVDLLTRAAYRTQGLVETSSEGTVITDLPIYDAPVLVVDSRMVAAR